MPSILTYLARLKRDPAGTSAIEFALVLPLMVILYFGAVEFSDALTVNRKLTRATSASADLVAQAETIDADEMANIFDAAKAIISPYQSDPMALVISSIRIDENGQAKVDWSKTDGGTERAVGSTVSLPADIAVPETSLIMAEAAYEYTSILGMFIDMPITLTETFYLRPRIGEWVTWSSS